MPLFLDITRNCEQNKFEICTELLEAIQAKIKRGDNLQYYEKHCKDFEEALNPIIARKDAIFSDDPFLSGPLVVMKQAFQDVDNAWKEMKESDTSCKRQKFTHYTGYAEVVNNTKKPTFPTYVQVQKIPSIHGSVRVLVQKLTPKTYGSVCALVEPPITPVTCTSMFFHV